MSRDNAGVGLALWVISGIAAFGLARIIPIRRRRPFAESATAVAAALIAGLSATALDFGGLGELDWRAGVFSFLIAAAAVGLLRLANAPALSNDKH